MDTALVVVGVPLPQHNLTKIKTTTTTDLHLRQDALGLGHRVAVGLAVERVGPREPVVAQYALLKGGCICKVWTDG